MSTRATTVTYAPESITAHHSHVRTKPITAAPTATPILKKQADLYLQRCELDRDFAGGSVPFCCGLMRLTESGPSLFGSGEIQRRADNKVKSESVDVHVLLAASPPNTAHLPRRRIRPTGTSKTGLRVNNVGCTFSQTLPSRLLCVWCRKKW